MPRLPVADHQSLGSRLLAVANLITYLTLTLQDASKRVESTTLKK